MRKVKPRRNKQIMEEKIERVNSNRHYRVSAYVVLIILLMIYLGTPVAGEYVLWRRLIMQIMLLYITPFFIALFHEDFKSKILVYSIIIGMIIFQGVATKDLVLDAVQGPKSMTIVNAHYSRARRIRYGTKYYIVGKDETGEEISFSINGQDYKNDPYDPSDLNDYHNTMRIKYYENTHTLISFED